jgi:hypothetical protein
MASELSVGDKWDRCMTRAITYTAAGVTSGALLSLVFFKRACAGHADRLLSPFNF